jgi:hypothetical protein
VIELPRAGLVGILSGESPVPIFNIRISRNASVETGLRLEETGSKERLPSAIEVKGSNSCGARIVHGTALVRSRLPNRPKESPVCAKASGFSALSLL